MKIVLCYPTVDQHVAKIRRTLGEDCQIVLVGSHDSPTDELCGADIFCGHAKVPVDWQSVVETAKLKWIQSSAAGMDHCLSPVVIESPILVTSASGLFRDQVAEQTMALLYGLIRRLPTFFRAALNQQFVRQPTDDLHGKTIGIVGFGANGQRIAEMLVPTGCRIVATDRYPQEWHDSFELPKIDQLWPADRLDDLLRESNVVILTLPLMADTDRIMDRQRIELMPRHAYLINVGRGQLIDEDALAEALQSGHLSGAGLDVTAVEPLPPASILWELSNVIITPHVGAQSKKRFDDVTDLFCENLLRFVQGQRLRNLVDKEIGFPLPHDRI